MVKTINVKSSGDYEINFGDNSINGNIEDVVSEIPESMLAIILNLVADATSQGASEIHIEVDAFNSFTHVRKGSDVISHSADAILSADNFSAVINGWSDIVALQDARYAEQLAAAEAAANVATEVTQ